MLKRLHVHVDAATWPPGVSPPPGLMPASGVSQINILDMMLCIGVLSLPVTASAITLNAWWAWLRYACAFSSSNDFVLASAYRDLDSHQKTILSDDFGMGVALTHVIPALGLRGVCDGRYFIQRIAPDISARAARIAKNGQFKSPDFVGIDANGKWHLLECKGTQVDFNRPGQMQTGRLQKSNIIFPPGLAGEKLVSGLMIGFEDRGPPSSLLIEDPDGDINFKIDERLIPAAREAMDRGTIARLLGAVGLYHAASIIASPHGINAYDRPSENLRNVGKREQARRALIAAKHTAAVSEIADLSDRKVIFLGEGRLGWSRRAELEFPAIMVVDGASYSSAVIQFEVSDALLNTVNEIAERSRPNSAEAFASFELGGFTTEGDRSTRTLHIGEIFKASIELLP